MAIGRKTGGRQKGTPNKATVEKELRAAKGVEAAVAEGVMPLDVILGVMRGEAKYTREQFEAAKEAAPYLHPKLSSATLTHKDVFGGWTAEQLERAAEWLERHGPGEAGEVPQAEGGAGEGREPDSGLSAVH